MIVPATHATLPFYVERDLQSFVLFFVSPVQFEFDPKSGTLLRASRQEILTSIWKATKAMTILSIMLGITIHYNFEMFEKREVTSFLDLFYWKNLCNNYVMACKFWFV